MSTFDLREMPETDLDQYYDIRAQAFGRPEAEREEWRTRVAADADALRLGAYRRSELVGGLRILPAGPVATLVLAEPVVATVLGVVVLGERLGPAGWVGCLLVLAGLALQGVVSGSARGEPGGEVRAGDLDVRAGHERPTGE